MSNATGIGYVKYSGQGITEGIMDARKQATALLGIDSALRFYINKQSPDIQKYDYEIPIKIQKGSWEALIPDSTAEWVITTACALGFAYTKKAVEKMAENDFGDVGFKDVIEKAINALKWFARIAIHLGNTTTKTFTSVKFTDNNSKIGIKNKSGKFLYVPKYILDMYVTSNPNLLEQLANNISDNKSLIIGTFNNNEIDEVIINNSNKFIFCQDDTEEQIFPELKHGDLVTLEGEVTRENKTTNNMGFKYLNHILTAYPENGNIVQYKQLLFLNCKLFGVVSRADEKGNISLIKPKLIFSNLEPLDCDKNNTLF